MRKSTRKTLKIILVLALTFSIYPLVVGMTGVGFGTSPYSPYNKGEIGLSKLRGRLIEQGYEAKTIISSLKTLGRMNRTGVLIIAGPTRSYDFQETLHVLLDFVLKGGSVLIANDFGKANSLLKSVWRLTSQLSGNQMEILFNTTSVVCERREKYYEGSPARPIITNFAHGILPEEVNEVQTSFPTTFCIKSNNTTTVLPASAGLMSTTEESWLESDLSSARKGRAQPNADEWGRVRFPLGLTLGLGGDTGNIGLISDPDIFSNALLNKRDNWLFSSNIIEWLAEPANSDLIIFDESHHSFTPFDPLYGFNLWFGVLTMISSSWIIAPLIPLVTFIFILGYLPRKKKFRAVTLRHKERKAQGPSVFQSRIRRYMKSKSYRGGANTLLGLVLRQISRYYSMEIEGIDELMEKLPNIRADLMEEKPSKMNRFLTLLKQASEGEKLTKEDFVEVMEIYGEIKDSLFP